MTDQNASSLASLHRKTVIFFLKKSKISLHFSVAQYNW